MSARFPLAVRATVSLEGAPSEHALPVILDTARSLFVEGGYEAASIAAVALGAGVSRQAIYRHFADPREMLRALVDRDVDDLVGRLHAPLSAIGDVDTLVGASLEVFIDFVLEHRREYLLLFGQAGRAELGVASILAGLRARLAGIYMSVFAPAIEAAGVAWPPPAQARLIAYALMALCDGVVLAWLESPEPELGREDVRQLLQVMVVRALVA